MTTTATKPRTTPPQLGLHEQLEAVLRLLLSEHEQLLSLTTEHRRAISEADVGALRACVSRQGEVVGRIGTLERQRQQLAGTLTGQKLGAPGAANTPGPTMTILAKAAPEPIRSRLLAITVALRELLNRLHKEHLALRSAAETLSSHMEGVMRQVCRTLSHAGTYARSGAIDSSVQVVTSLDLKT